MTNFANLMITFCLILNVMSVSAISSSELSFFLRGGEQNYHNNHHSTHEKSTLRIINDERVIITTNDDTVVNKKVVEGEGEETKKEDTTDSHYEKMGDIIKEVTEKEENWKSFLDSSSSFGTLSSILFDITTIPPSAIKELLHASMERLVCVTSCHDRKKLSLTECLQTCTVG